MKTRDFKYLLNKYHNGTCNPREQALIEFFCLNQEFGRENLDLNKLNLSNRKTIDNLRNITPLKRNNIFRHSTIAAAIILIVGIGLLIFTSRENKGLNDNDVDPGSNKAILTLANGKKIILNDAKNGTVLIQNGLKITKSADGTLIYKVGSKSTKEEPIQINTITTPKGGQYKIVLSDGTKVWLNAATSLSYTASLNERGGARRIKMSGEAYFEVAKNKDHPFIVVTDQQEIKVLGTHFNVSAYKDDPAVKTTLLEGAVSVSLHSSKSVTLKPNQQSVLTSNHIKIYNINTASVVSWKDGEFSFSAENLESILRKIGRWYDVDFIYTDRQVGNKPFNGSISKFEKISKVLNLLEITEEVKFKIEGRRIIVSE